MPVQQLRLHVLAYNPENTCDADAIKQWTPREKLVKGGAKIIGHGCGIVFQVAEVAFPSELLADILRRIDRLHKPGGRWHNPPLG
jgi:hypothetical protein